MFRGGVHMTHDLNENEQHILKLIKENAFISQIELSEKVGLSRSSVANIISGLVKKGYIFGKAYVLNETRPIVCIGGANVDRKFYAKERIINGTSNPVRSSQSVGGVARNIAENLGRMGEEVIFLSVSGNDSNWKEINDLSSPFMNLDYVAQFEDASTGSYTAVLNMDGNLEIALADMDIYDWITPELLAKNSALLRKARCIIVDLNCPSETIEFLCSFSLKYQIPIAVIPVSAPKMKRLPQNIGSVTWLITNVDETEAFLNCRIENAEDWQRAVGKWLELGAENVIITNGATGVMAGGKNEPIRHFPSINTPDVVDVTGAGDSFCAGVLFSWLQNKPFDVVVRSGIVNAHKTLLSNYTVRQDLSENQFEIDLEELS